jgi:type IV secretory pathway VirB2 component (pilin)
LKENLNDVETGQSASEFIQNIIVYLIGFISIVAVVYIIYAGFNILTGTGDEEKIKKSKSIILYVVI